MLVQLARLVAAAEDLNVDRTTEGGPEALVAVLLAVTGTVLAALGGFFFGRWWERRLQAFSAKQAELRFEEAIEQVLRRLDVDGDIAREVDPLAGAGRSALSAILDKIQDYGAYTAVVLSDDAGLVIASSGPEEATELMAIEAAAFGAAAERVHEGRQSILQAQPDSRWTLHRFFDIELGRICLSAGRQGGTPRLNALDGALAAFERVLSSPTAPASDPMDASFPPIQEARNEDFPSSTSAQPK